MSTFVVVTPATMTDAALVSSTVAEADYDEWDVSTTYADGDVVMVLSTHRIYTSAVGSNTGNDPTADGSIYWTETDATNRWRMFDDSTGSATSDTSTGVIVMQPGRADTVALLELTANSVRVQQTIGGTEVYDETQTGAARTDTVTTWSAYFAGGFTISDFLLFDGLTADGTSTITVTIDGGTGTWEVGELVAGVAATLGATEYGASAGIADYSRKTTDATTGRTTLEQRRYAKTMKTTLTVDNAVVDVVARRLAALRATPALWVGVSDGGYELLSVFGWVRDWQIAIRYPGFSLLTLQIEGLA